jgi:hypothetical protein
MIWVKYRAICDLEDWNQPFMKRILHRLLTTPLACKTLVDLVQLHFIHHCNFARYVGTWVRTSQRPEDVGYSTTNDVAMEVREKTEW